VSPLHSRLDRCAHFNNYTGPDKGKIQKLRRSRTNLTNLRRRFRSGAVEKDAADSGDQATHCERRVGKKDSVKRQARTAQAFGMTEHIGQAIQNTAKAAGIELVLKP